MITTGTLPSGDIAVTFSIEGLRAISVVGDFNNWDPTQHPLNAEPSGQQSVTITMPADTTIRFRYLVEGSEFSDDPGADRWEANGYGQTHSVLDRYLQACGEAPRFDARRAPAAADIAVGPVLNRDRQVA